MSRTHPLANGTVVTQAFRPRSNPTHDGTDFRAVTGTPLYASMSGTVRTGTGHPKAGTWVEIHSGDTFIGYSHMSSRAVKAGQQVNKGDVIGASGATGHVTGAHLHFYVKRVGAFINPVAWLAEATAPTPTPSAPAHGADSATLAYQKRQNVYGAAGLAEDGDDGPLTKGWRAWVEKAQSEMNKWKSDKADIAVDGDYGAGTNARAVELQKRNGLPVTGHLSNADAAYMRKHGSTLPNRPVTR